MAVASHIRLAEIGADLVIFDLREDRYLALSDAIEPAAVSSKQQEADMAMRLHPAALAALIDAGMLVNAGRRADSHVQRAFKALPAEEARVRARDLGRLLLALLRTGWRIRRGRHVMLFADEGAPPSSSLEQERLQLAMAKLRRLRLFVPTPTRCLPAALTAALFVRQFGVQVDLVFGVRTHPFDAHCWIERDGIVLDDQLERVSAYTPIAIGKPSA